MQDQHSTTEPVTVRSTGRHSVVLFAALLIVWLLWSGHYTPLLISCGVFSCALTLWLCRRMGVVDAESVPIAAAGDILRYLPWLLWEIVKSNVTVVRAVLTGRCEPTWVETKASQQTDLGIATYANSITLTPGTVTVDAIGTFLHVHALTRETAEDVESGEMDRRVTQMERRLLPTAYRASADAEKPEKSS